MTLQLFDAMKISQLKKTFENKQMPISVAFKINKLLLAVKDHVHFYQKEMEKIVKKFGEIDENGQLIPTKDGTGVKIKQDCLEACEKRVQDLCELPVEISDEIVFSLEDFGETHVELSDIQILDKFIK